TKLVQRKKGDNVFTVSFHDKPFSQGVLIDDDNFGSLDRIYDTKGIETMFIKLSNIGANGITFVIEGTQVEFTLLSALVDGDFTKTLEAESLVSAGQSVEFTEDLMGPEVTAVRIRMRRSNAGQSSTMLGIVSAD
ncbi:MAG: hypothetical protein QQN41_09915, partial [Nitrosopumilus sp.]